MQKFPVGATMPRNGEAPGLVAVADGARRQQKAITQPEVVGDQLVRRHVTFVRSAGSVK